MSAKGKAAPAGRPRAAVAKAASADEATCYFYYTPDGEKKQGPRHGKIEGGVWRKTVQASRHQLRRPPAWCVDVSDLAAAEAASVEWLEIHDTETNITWSAPLSKFHGFGVKISRGHGEQIALPLAHWSRRKVGEPAGVSQQLKLALFGGREGRNEH